MHREKKEKREKLSRVDVVARLGELEDAIEHLRLSYEKYFRGVERVVPARERERVERMLRLWEGMPPTGTALRFRLQGLRARFVTYSHYWNRILNEIENGTYKPDLQRLARKQEAMKRNEAGAPAVVEAEAATGGRPSARRGEVCGPGKREQSAPQLPSGMTAREARALFKELVAKKRAAGESTNGLTYGALLRKLSKQIPKLREHYGDALRFEVATDGGRVRLKAKRAKNLG